MKFSLEEKYTQFFFNFIVEENKLSRIFRIDQRVWK